MDTTQRVRLISGVLLSPLIVPVSVYLTFLVFFGLNNYNSEATLDSIRTIFWLNYVVTIVLGIPAYLFFHAKGFESLRHYAGLGAVFGFILITIISNNFVYVFYIVFCLAGVLVGVAFWFIVYFQPQSTRRRGRRTRRRSRH